MGIKTKIVGIAYKNDNGMPRQELLLRAKLRGDEYVNLEHEKNNPNSDHAIAVRDINGHQLGYLKDALAADIIDWIKKRGSTKAQILNITGGEDEVNFECNIEIPVTIEWGPEEETKPKKEKEKEKGKEKEKEKEKEIQSGCLGWIILTIVAFISFLYVSRWLIK